MAEVKLTKTELRAQQIRLAQLQKYLPTLQLKKAMLQSEISLAQTEVDKLLQESDLQEKKILEFSVLLSSRNIQGLIDAVKIETIEVSHENIAGVDIPVFQNIGFGEISYSLFDTPIWFESAIDQIRNLLTTQEKRKIAQDKCSALQRELREVSIRVNLFEKVMIPRAKENIKRIRIFLGDQQLAAISQAKVSKKKISGVR